MLKANDGRTDGQPMDGQTTLHKLTWSKAPGELTRAPPSGALYARGK